MDYYYMTANMIIPSITVKSKKKYTGTFMRQIEKTDDNRIKEDILLAEKSGYEESENFIMSWNDILNIRYDTPFDIRDIHNGNVISCGKFYFTVSICAAADILRDESENIHVYMPRKTCPVIILTTDNGLAVVRGYKLTENILRRIKTQ